MKVDKLYDFQENGKVHFTSSNTSNTSAVDVYYLREKMKFLAATIYDLGSKYSTIKFNKNGVSFNLAGFIIKTAQEISTNL